MVMYLGPGVSRSSMLLLWVVGGPRSGGSPILPLLRLWSVGYAWHLHFLDLQLPFGFLLLFFLYVGL